MNQACHLLNSRADPIDGWAQFVQETNGGGCNQFTWDSFMAPINSTTAPNGDRSWYYISYSIALNNQI